ncbi:MULTISPECIES: endonuclease/exonuclease/phosphatase family protein [Campylobacter]|uniref:endonuclease/exonuclease/phosphatase family protein n=2 Tax=Campylobacteraceae TaxID=72294 RepID=UPI0019D2A135|nr:MULTISPECIES: endonuclease/exonuclease/phosphatase family protein [Campylobacter]MBN7289195.1 endonuclease/exonuclease/phosphatase family protein [Campylobacter curvus]MDU6826373.1 endonuclease/exonuclease/phosphatase family protein [Campylobacter sp.]
MRVFWLVVLSALISLAGEISIATYNVENLFDCKNDGSEYTDFRVGSSSWDCAAANEKVSRIKEVILSLDSDIIALEEIENEEILKELAKGTQYKYVLFTAQKGAPIGLGLISKIRPVKSEIFKVPNAKTRNILKVNFELEGKNFSIFVNHFPAYKNGKTEQQKAERTLRAALENEKNAVLLGDFNTPYGSRSLLNDIIRTRSYVDLWEFLEAKERYSHAVHGRKSAIDHVLLSPSFFENGELSYVFESFEVFKPAFMKDENGYVRSQDGVNLYSDHFPLRFKISTQPSGQRSGFFTKIFGFKDEVNAASQEGKNSPAFGSEYKISNIDDIFAKPENSPFFLSRAVVIYKDKNGFILGEDHRGIYVFDPQNDLELGQMMDVLVTKTKIYKDALEVGAYEIKKMYGVVQPDAFMMSASMLKEARDGDVIDKISGELKGGYLHTPYGRIRVYSPKGRIFDNKNIDFERVRVKSYKGQNQLYVE